MTATWWRRSVGYEVYIRSFADGDGDGVGDLRGIIGRLDELAWLGIDLVWISPCMPSPMHDHGYDVSDYTGIDPAFGTLADLDELVAQARRRGIRILMDLVPNHTSSEHPWFRAALADPSGPYRDYYLWRDPRPDGGPPNNWRSHFGGPAWTLDEASGQYHLHLFLPQQPDLNWRNPRVHEEFRRILAFWLDRGVAGFRIDVAHSLHKHPDLPDLPPRPEDVPSRSGSDFDELHHVFDLDQADNVLAHRAWRQVTEPAGALLLGETYLLSAELLHRYHDPDEGLNASFWFPPMHLDWSPAAVRDLLVDALRMPPGTLAWITGSHDGPRAASRFGGGDLGRRRALGLTAMLWALDGIPFVYQGEELGLLDPALRLEDMQDPLARRHPEDAARRSRDLARTPMPWSPDPGMGFTAPGVEPWLPFGGRTAADTWAAQRRDERSWLHAWRRLIAAWRALPDDLPAACWVDEGDAALLAFRRGQVLAALNAGEDDVGLPLPGPGVVAFHRDPACEGRRPEGALVLAPGDALWVRLDDEPGQV